MVCLASVQKRQLRAAASLSPRVLRSRAQDLAILGDTVTIAVGKDGVKFSVAGELGSGNMTIRPSSVRHHQPACTLPHTAHEARA